MSAKQALKIGAVALIAVAIAVRVPQIRQIVGL